MKIEFYRSFNPLRFRKEWRWRAIHGNGQILANSAESYVRKIDCESAARTLSNRMATAVWNYV